MPDDVASLASCISTVAAAEAWRSVIIHITNSNLIYLLITVSYHEIVCILVTDLGDFCRNDPTRPECSLNLAQPCMFNDALVTTMAPVQPLNFTSINPNAYWESYLGVPPTNLVRTCLFTARPAVL